MKQGWIPILLTALTLTALPARASEGRIPVWEPTVITQPGHYVLTRDLTVPAGVIPIQIRTGGVTVDLNGHVLESAGITEPVILISGADTGVTVVHNGEIRGGLHGIHALSGGLQRRLFCRDLRISHPFSHGILVESTDDVELLRIVIGGGQVGIELLNAAGATGTAHISYPGEWCPTLTSCSPAIRVRGVTTLIEGGILELLPDGGIPAIELIDAPRSIIRNVVVGFRPDPGGAGATGPVIRLQNSPGVLIADNTIHGNGSDGSNGIFVDDTSDRVKIINNVITSCGNDGIQVLSEGSFIVDNLVGGNGGAGIFVGGSNNLVQGNKAGENTGVGIHFETPGHVYRDNVLLGNTGGATGGKGEADVTDGGGNIP